MSNFGERPATPDDAAWIVALHASPHAAPFLQQPGEDDVRSSLVRGDGRAERIVLDAHGERIALWRVSLESGWCAELRTLAVVPGYGAGTWALRRALAWAFEERGVHRLMLYVTAANARARALYERHGLSLEGTERDGFRSIGGAFEDLCHYGLLDREYARHDWPSPELERNEP